MHMPHICCLVLLFFFFRYVYIHTYVFFSTTANFCSCLHISLKEIKRHLEFIYVCMYVYVNGRNELCRVEAGPKSSYVYSCNRQTDRQTDRIGIAVQKCCSQDPRENRGELCKECGKVRGTR